MLSSARLRLTSRRFDVLAFAVPLGITVAFFLIYLVSPHTYLTYILEAVNREKQAVEILTWTAALAAAVLLFPTAVRLQLQTRHAGGSPLPGAVLFIGLVALAAFFFAGEELSWGQTWFHWRTPSELKTVSRETNLHNGRLGGLVHTGGNLFMLVMFVGLPIVWRFRDRLRLPLDWRAGIAEWPVAATAILADLVRVPKQIFAATHTSVQMHASPFYMQYLEEIDEQKEMLIAFAMLIYALYRLQAVRAERGAALAEAAIAASPTPAVAPT